MTLYTPRRETKYIAVHCSATPPTLNVGAKEIREWHRQKGWIDIGYHFVIRRDGKVEAGRPLDTVGAHVEGFNAVSVGICMVGGVDTANRPQDNFTPAQFAALATKLRELKAKYPNAIIQGHRDFPHVSKACPSFDVRKWLSEAGVFANHPAENEHPATAMKTFVVSSGDTLWAIARAHGVSTLDILELNPGLNPLKLQVGQTINVPA